MTPSERASRYVAALPASISGSRGHDALFRVACVLVNGFDLSDAGAWPTLLEYNTRCLPPWNERELRHKLVEARKVAHREHAGHLLGDRPIVPIRPEPEKTPRILGRIALVESTFAPGAPPAAADLSEAHRIAGELVRMFQDGALSGPNDPDAPLYAAVMLTFGGRYCDARSKVKSTDAVRWTSSARAAAMRRSLLLRRRRTIGGHRPEGDTIFKMALWHRPCCDNCPLGTQVRRHSPMVGQSA